MPRAFLTARWCNLILANYPVPDDLLLPLLPPGVELDRWNGSAFVSLVGFQFLDTKVAGVGWPTFRHFPEWTMRDPKNRLFPLRFLDIPRRTDRTISANLHR